MLPISAAMNAIAASKPTLTQSTDVQSIGMFGMLRLPSCRGDAAAHSHRQLSEKPAMRRPASRAVRLGRSAAPELVADRRRARRRRALVLVPEDDAALVEIVRRHLDRHPISRERLDAVLLHAPGRVGDDRVPVVELDAKAR